MTRFAAEHADIVGYVPRSLPKGGLDPAEFSTSAFSEKVAVLDQALAGLGGPGPERGALLFYTGRTADDMPTDQNLAWTSPEVLVESPYALVGDPAQMVDTLLERRERWGLTYLTCWEQDINLLIPVIAALAGT